MAMNIEVTALSLSSGEVMRIVRNQQYKEKVWPGNFPSKQVYQYQCFNDATTTTTTKNFDSRKSVYQALLVKEIDVIVLAICESSNNNTILQKLCDEIQTRYFTGPADGNDFAREYLFSTLMNKLKRRCQEFGSLREKKTKMEAINIYNFLGAFYFHILTISWNKLLRQLESLVIVASHHLLKPFSYGTSESLSTWLFKLGPYLYAHFPMTLNSLMDRIRDKFLDNLTTEHARQHLITLIDCHAREWVIRFD